MSDESDGSAGEPVDTDAPASDRTQAAEHSRGPTDDGNEVAALSFGDFVDALSDRGRPVVTADEVARVLGWSQAETHDALAALEGRGEVSRFDVSADPVVWYPADWGRLADRERVIFFPEQRRIVVHHPAQFTRAQLSQFAHLIDTTRTGAYMYEVRREDVWGAPYEDFEGLLGTVRDVVPERSPAFEEWLREQWTRANQFRLVTHPEGYVVLEAATESLMGNVARQKLDDGQLRAAISETESWVAEEATAAVKRVLYEAGYPVADERDLETGDPLDVDLSISLRDYQRDWVERFESAGSGVLVGPPGSGKTVAAMGIIAAVGGETLVLVPSRELASQWRDALLDHTSLSPAQVGLYHGGEKSVRPVTIATYQVAGMDRHRQLFDQRAWGLIVFDEVHHVPAPVYRRSVDLQGKHRLGLSATPVRGDDREEEIFTLVGPPIGTDWDALFDAGFVAQPEVEIRYVPWADDEARNEWASADGHERRMLEATNPAKVDETRRLLARHGGEKALVFVDYLDQGTRMAAALDAPFVSGEMRHADREGHFADFRDGDRDVLVVSRVGDEGIDLPNAEVAVVASGLGGSRRQGSQRAGRTMRPVGGARVYVLATRGTAEEDFATRRMSHLASKGIRVTERTLSAVDASGGSTAEGAPGSPSADEAGDATGDDT